MKKFRPDINTPKIKVDNRNKTYLKKHEKYKGGGNVYSKKLDRNANIPNYDTREHETKSFVKTSNEALNVKLE